MAAAKSGRDDAHSRSPAVSRASGHGEPHGVGNRRRRSDRDEFVLVATKYRPPQVRDQLVRRKRLLELLTSGTDRRLTLIACPAGYGKTSLLADWHTTVSTTRPIAWLTLDRGDNDPVVLWSYVVEALRRVCPGVGDSVQSSTPGAPLVMELLLPRLVNALDELPGITLVLDDFHLLGDGPARDSIGWLIEQAPPSFQLVVSSRREPDLPLGALRAHGDLLELRADDLRFTVAECDEFLNGRQLLGLTDSDIRSLVERTDGWPAALYLAALSLRRAVNRHDLVTRFGASNRHVVDFLETEVMQSHDESDRDFLVQCSVLERMTGPLCDEVLGTENSAETLRRLSRTNLFLVPLDDQGDWYRFHPLFSRLLQIELARRDAGLARQLHERAYAWHRDHGHITEAVEHAIECELYDRAAEIVEASYARFINAGRESAVEYWLTRFPVEVSTSDPRLLLAAGWIQWLTGQHRQVHATIARIEQVTFAEGAESVSITGETEVGLAVLKATVPEEGGDDAGARAVELAPPGSTWRPIACWARALGAYGRGDLAEADRWFAESVELAPASGQWLVGGSSLGYRSLIAGERGDRTGQADLADQALAFMRSRGLEEVGVDAWHAVGVSLAARGEVEAGRTALERAVAVARFRGQPVLIARALRSLAAVHRELGATATAASAEAEATRILASSPDHRLLATRALRSRSARPANRTAGAGDELTERELTVLTFLTSDRSEAEIARELFVSHSTVHSHARAIYRKLAVSSRADALRRARELGLLAVT